MTHLNHAPSEPPTGGRVPDWPPRRRRTRTALLVVLGTVGLLFVGCAAVIAVIGASLEDPPGGSAVAGLAVPTAAPARTDLAPTTALGTPTPAPAAPKPVRLSGRGDDVVRVRKPGGASGAVLATITGRGSGHFAVAAKGGEEQLLVNEIGSYSGTVLLDPYDGVETSRLVVTADGPWTITLADVSTARRVTGGTFRGRGDSVVAYAGPGGVGTFTGPRGEYNFAVTAYSAAGTGLLVNEIGAYTGTVEIPAGPALLVVTAHGGWTADIRAG